MGFAEDANALIQEKKFDDLESLWMNQIDSDPGDVDAFIRTAKTLRKSEQRTQSDTLLGLLADTLLEKKKWAERLQVLKEMVPDLAKVAVLRNPVGASFWRTIETVARSLGIEPRNWKMAPDLARFCGASAL